MSLARNPEAEWRCEGLEGHDFRVAGTLPYVTAEAHRHFDAYHKDITTSLRERLIGVHPKAKGA